MIRLVLDTNVVVADLLWAGTPRRPLDPAIDETVTLFSSPALIEERAHTLHYQKFVQRIDGFDTTPQAPVGQYSALVTLVLPTQVPRVIENDIDDDQILAAAVAAQADLIVSGDRKHLRPLGSDAGIAIVTPAEAFRRVEPIQKSYDLCDKSRREAILRGINISNIGGHSKATMPPAKTRGQAHEQTVFEP